jgi:hypothetical protein
MAMKYLIMFLVSLGMLAALTIYAGAQSSMGASSYFGPMSGNYYPPTPGDRGCWSIASNLCKAPQQARPQRIKQPRR